MIISGKMTQNFVLRAKTKVWFFDLIQMVCCFIQNQKFLFFFFSDHLEKGEKKLKWKRKKQDDGVKKY